MPPRANNEALDFVVDRSDLRRCRVIARSAAPAPADGDVLLRVDAFALTANNVTYAVAGDMMSYWSFFPAEGEWGRVPVWGFADVIASRHGAVRIGERIFGYLPMSTHLVVRPDRLTASGFVDATPHRAALPAVYNQYARVAADPAYQVGAENELMVFRPLFMTAFLLDDFLADNGFFGASAVVLSSASSKTAVGLASLLAERRQAEVVGLTSPGNAAFVAGLGCYDRVVRYDDIASLRPGPAAFVDMAGDGRVVRTVHEHYGDDLRHSSVVGLTHWQQRAATAEGLPGAPPTFFFAPTQLEKRTREWGGEEFQRRYAAAWERFLTFIRPHIHFVHGRGPEEVERVYREVLEGRSRPDQAFILSLWSDRE